MEQQIPLSHEASAGDTHKQVTESLPPKVVQCLENARFLHLATCTNNTPHVSLMNYTYLPSSPYSASPVVVMTTNPSSKKTTNLAANPSVSLLVHDWVSHRPPTSHTRRLSGGAGGRGSSSSPGRGPPIAPEGSLASLLLNLNTSAVSSISATINGSARLAARGSDEESFYRARHLENNTFDSAGPLLFGGGAGEGDDEVPPASNGGGRFGSGPPEDVRVIVVAITDVRISDWKGAVRDWVIVAPRSARANGQG